MRRRVVITGCGVVTAAGIDLDVFWDALMRGECFIGPLRGFSYRDMPDLQGAEVHLPPGDDLDPSIDRDSYRSRCEQLALAASRRAMSDARFSSEAGDFRERAGVALGTTLGSERQVGDLNERSADRGPDAIDGDLCARIDNHRIAALLARQQGFGGPVVLCATACASGNAATAAAFDLVASGAADVMIAGGADALTRLIYCGFYRMGALSKTICRPFDRTRDGVSFGEGAGALVLEDLDGARRRGAHVYCEVAGYGISNDAHHITAPDPHGDGFARAMRQAMEKSGTRLDEIDYVSAHGTGTQYNDLGEIRAMKAVFGDRAKQIPMSSIKSIIGHTNGAASAIESVACALAIERQAVPPTVRLVEPDPECDLDCVPGTGRPAHVAACLNLAAGFGGCNVCLVLKRAS